MCNTLDKWLQTLIASNLPMNIPFVFSLAIYLHGEIIFVVAVFFFLSVCVCVSCWDKSICHRGWERMSDRIANKKYVWRQTDQLNPMIRPYKNHLISASTTIWRRIDRLLTHRQSQKDYKLSQPVRGLTRTTNRTKPTARTKEINATMWLSSENRRKYEFIIWW